MASSARFAVGRRIAPTRFLLFALLLLAGAGGLIAFGAGPRTALLVGFDAATIVFLMSVLPLLGAKPDDIRHTAADNDANRAGLLAISVLLSLVILFAAGTLIARPGSLTVAEIALVIGTLVLSWLFGNTVFALHYAHLYYWQSQGRDQGGIEVPRMPHPGYWEFIYFSFTLGMTFQTSDVVITGAHLRRVALGHSMAAFVFNMGILAFTVNALGG